MPTTFFALLGLGLFINITLITLGALLSKRFDFNFSTLGVFSLCFYLALSCAGTKMIDATAGITLVGLIGLFESIIGIRIIVALGGKLDDLDAEIIEILNEQKNPPPIVVVVMVLAYMFIGWIGTFLA